MVLLVCDRQFKSNGIDIMGYQASNFKDIFDNFTEYHRFGEMGCVHINSSNEILYVNQGEMAIAKFNDTNNQSLPPYAGTSEMTSCHAVILKSSTGFAISHLDGSSFEQSEEFFNQSVQTLVHNAEEEITDVHIVGGFLDEEGYSRQLLLQIMTYLLTTPKKFRLKTLSCYHFNDRIRDEPGTERIHEPIHRAVVFEIATGTVKPASIAPEGRGPLSVLRNASLSSIPSRLHNVLDPTSHVLRIHKFLIPTSIMIYNVRRANKTNAELANCSTTPLQETDHFYDMLRRTASLMASMLKEGRDFFARGDLEFAFDPDLQLWKPLNPQTLEAVKHPFTSF